MNKQLVYKSKIGFLNVLSQNFSNDMTPTFYNESVGTAQMKKDYVFGAANNCRWWYEPIFSNETKYLPVQEDVKELPVVIEPQNVSIAELTNFDTKEELTLPPKQKQEELLMNALVVGLVAVVVFKILS
jgi:hypothetical protein